MQKRKTLFPLFSILLIVSLVLFFLSRQGVLQSIPFINTVFSPLQRIVFSNTQTIANHDVKNTQLEQENKELLQQFITYKKLQNDNVALRDQFQTATIPTTHLLPTHIVSEPGFIPGSVAIEQFIIDTGSRDGVKNGMAVVYKDNLVGKVIKVTPTFSQVVVITNKTISFAAKTLHTSALGVAKGQGSGDILLDDVILDQTLQVNDLVVTRGDLNLQGQGYPPDLIVGKITGIERDPSALFQRGNISSLIDITKLSMVFVMVTQ